MKLTHFLGRALVLCALAGVSTAVAQPTNTTLPPGGSWVASGTGTYSTGTLNTETGGSPGQTAPPYFDTSFGVMDEPQTPWFTGNDLSAQQFIQKQVFGDLGAAAPSPAPWGFAGPPPAGDSQQRFYNYGYGGTTAGSNFPMGITEQRSLTVPHWNNPSPDAGGVGSAGQVVCIPVSAKITIGMGWGGDEMFLDIIGGDSGQQSNFMISTDIDAAYTINGTGAYTGSANGEILYNADIQNNDAGPGGAYQAGSWGLNNGGTAGAIGFNTGGSMTWNGTTVTPVSGGIPANSIGTAISEVTGMDDMYTLTAADVVDTGGSFSVDFDGAAMITSIVRNFGNADARASLGPGMAGTVTYEVQYEHWTIEVVPEPSAISLLLVAMMPAVTFLRRRRR